MRCLYRKKNLNEDEYQIHIKSKLAGPLFYVLYKKYKRYISISIQHDDMVLVQITCKNLFEVEQHNLERGHSIMEADSEDSTLERLFSSPIYTSWDYLSRIRQARQFQSY